MKLLKYGLTIAAVFMVLIVIRFNYNLRDRHPDFNIDLVIDPLAEPGRLSVGFAKIRSRRKLLIPGMTLIIMQNMSLNKVRPTMM